MKEFRLDLLPDDVVRLVFNLWLSGDQLKILFRMTVAFRGTTLRSGFEDFMRNYSIGLKSKNFSSDLSAVGAAQWMTNYGLSINSLYISWSDCNFIQWLCQQRDMLSSIEVIKVETNYRIAPSMDSPVDAARNCLSFIHGAKCVKSLVLSLDPFSSSSVPVAELFSASQLESLRIINPLRSAMPIDFSALSSMHSRIRTISLNNFKIMRRDLRLLFAACPFLDNVDLTSIEFALDTDLPSLSDEETYLSRSVRHLALHKVSACDSKFLLLHCPNVESISCSEGQELLSTLFSSSLPLLQKVEISVPATAVKGIVTFDVEAQHPFGLQAPVGWTEPSQGRSFALQSLMSTFQAAGTVCRVKECSLDVTISRKNTVTRLPAFLDSIFTTAAEAARLSVEEEWLQLLTYPSVNSIIIQCTTSLPFHHSVLEEVLDKCSSLQLRGNVVSPTTLTSLRCLVWPLTNRSLSSLLMITPYLTSLELSNTHITTSALPSILRSLPKLDRLAFYSGVDILDCPDLSFDDVALDDRPKLTLLMSSNLVPTASLLLSIVHGLGPHLRRLRIMNAFKDCPLRALGEDFFKANRHVSITGPRMWGKTT